MDKSRPKPAPWLIKALKKSAQEKPQSEPEEDPEPAELFENFEQLEKEPQECDT